jgi:hypothetical protein
MTTAGRFRPAVLLERAMETRQLSGAMKKCRVLRSLEKLRKILPLTDK